MLLATDSITVTSFASSAVTLTTIVLASRVLLVEN